MPWKKIGQFAKKYGAKALVKLASDEERKLLARDELKNEVQPQVPLNEELENDRKLAGNDDFATIYLFFFE